MDRLAQLQQFIAQRPDDPFPRYALALEHRSRGALPAACEALVQLTQKMPDYVPAWLMLGQLHEQAGRVPEAKAAYLAGQAPAKAQGNRHALSELVGALEALGG